MNAIFSPNLSSALAHLSFKLSDHGVGSASLQDPAQTPSDASSSTPFELGALVSFQPAAGASTAAFSADPAATADAVEATPISELVDGTEPLPIDAVLALLSQDVYLEESAGPDALMGWRRLGADEIPEGVVPGNGHVDENGIIHGPGGLEAAIYVNEYGDYVVAFRGTQLGSGADLATNLDRSGFRVVTAQDGFAMDLAVNVTRAFPGRVVFTGHSMGGGHAITASIATGAPAIVFNPAGVNDSVLAAATARRNGSQGTSHTAQDLVEEANQGGVRIYQNEGDWVTHLQENSTAPDLPEAIGHRIGIEDHNGFPAILDGSVPVDPLAAVVFDAGLGWLPGLGLGGHHAISNTALGVFASGLSVVGIDGNAITVVTPSGNRGLPPGDVVLETVTFADTPEGAGARREFLLTGRLPDDMVGVESVATSFNTSNGASTTVVTHHGENGQPISGEEFHYLDGKEILRVDHAYGPNGEIVPDATRYTFQVTAENEDEARILNKVLYGTPDGPIRPGEAYTVTMTEAQMTDARASDPAWQSDPVAARDDPGADTSPNSRFALDLAAGDRGWAMAMVRLKTLSGTMDQPLDATVTDGAGNPVVAPEPGD